jgi:tRNA(fMet)-specific endonuclease VapC
MPWLLDTNGWILFLKPHQSGGHVIAQRLAQCDEEEILLCSVVKAELWHGAEKYENRTARIAKLGEIFARYRSLPFDDAAARHYADIRHHLESRGQTIGPNDFQIAAICLAHDLTLVSTNTGEFGRVPGLKVEDWTQEQVPQPVRNQ